MKPMHLALTMEKNHEFLHLGVEGPEKNFSFCSANFGPMKALGAIKQVPIRSPSYSQGLAGVRAIKAT